MSLIILTVVIGSLWAFSSMGMLDLELFVVNRLESVPAFADSAAIYRLGRTRNDAIQELEQGVLREARLLEAERFELEAERKSLQKEWADIQRERSQLTRDREQLEAEWQGLYEARALEYNIARLIELYEQMRPEELASVVVEVDDTLLIRLLMEMDERRAAQLLARIEPNRAARLSRIIAGERG